MSDTERDFKDIMWGSTPYKPGELAGVNEPMTEESFTAALERTMRYNPRPRPMIVSPTQHIRLDVGMRSESYHYVRNPWRNRIGRARAWIRYWRRNRNDYTYDDYPMTFRDALDWAWRELRRSQHSVFTPEAVREIEWRLAARGNINAWR